MKSALSKDIYRDIKKSLGRFISIVAIIALGVAFFTGIKVAPIVMKVSADKYYDDYNLMDITLIGTLGLTEKDITEIKKVPGVEGVAPSHSIEVLGKYNSNDMVFKAISLPKISEDKNNVNYINRVNLIEGRMPTSANECLVEKGSLDINDIPIGAKLTLSSGTKEDLSKNLENKEYEVVGVVQTPYYLSYEKGAASIGSGKIESFLMIPEENFKSDVYNEAFITVKGAKEVNSYNKDKYFDTVDKVLENIKEIEDSRNEERYNEVVLSTLKNFGINSIEELNVNNPMYNKINEIVQGINKPQWILLDRNSHYSYVDYGNSADSVDALAKIFPIIFFIVAALVCLTNMTRMVDEQRGNIGTLKALGYSKGKIASKYLIYALLASLLGSIIGLAIGFTVFPSVVFMSYGMMYTVPERVFLISIPLAIIGTLTAVLVTTLSALFACYKDLMEAPSELMRPRAPKLGKRIVLERIPFIWKRLNFTGKVTIRNIFRYKKRFFMTVIGIAGCTALLLTGFGIKDSIKTIVSKQFGTIYGYDMSVSVDKSLESSQIENVEKDISKISGIKETALISIENGKVINKEISKDLSIMVPDSIEGFNKLINLENRITKEKLSLEKDTVILTEKVAKELGVKVGDKVTLQNKDDNEAEVEVSGIAENYVGHNAYLTKETYESLFNSKPIFNQIIGSLENTEKDFENTISKELLNNKDVVGVSFNTEIKGTFDDTIKSLNYVVLILILSAGALAFIVLYNLTNVNISERIREIATIKVLGFYDNEVATYVYRENLILTIIGTIAGLGLGVILHKFIMVTVEMEAMMFGRNIDILSFVYSGALTLVFAAIVNYAMYYKLKNVKMVESLKSVE